MGLKDLIFGAPILGSEAALALLIAYLLGRYRPNWSRRNVLNLAALPVPFAIWVMCAFVAGAAMTAPKENCGVDACGMAMMAATMVAIMTVGLYLLGLLFAALGHRLTRRARIAP
jgi:hypothetical protein